MCYEQPITSQKILLFKFLFIERIIPYSLGNLYSQIKISSFCRFWPSSNLQKYSYMFWFKYKLPFFLKSLNLPIIFTSVVRIHLDGDFSDIVPLAKNHGEAVYIINSIRNCISSKRNALYIIIEKDFLIHTCGVMRYNTALPC